MMPCERKSTQEKRRPDGRLNDSQTGKRGIRPWDQGNSTLRAWVKGVRIVTHACSNPSFVLRDNRLSSSDPQRSGYDHNPIANALLHLRRQFTDCHQFQMLKRHLELSILRSFATMWLVWESPGETRRLLLIHTDKKNAYSEMKWGGEINEGGRGHFVWGMKSFPGSHSNLLGCCCCFKWKAWL